jgi:hypothetical protein
MPQTEKDKKRQYENMMLGWKVYDDDHTHQAGDNLLNFFFGDSGFTGFRGTGFFSDENLYDKAVKSVFDGKAKESLLTLSQPIDSRKAHNEFYDEYGLGMTIGNYGQGVLSLGAEGVVAGKVLKPVVKYGLKPGWSKLKSLFRKGGD